MENNINEESQYYGIGIANILSAKVEIMNELDTGTIKLK